MSAGITLGSAMSRSVKSNETKDLSVDVVNVAFSDLMEGNALESIPIFGLLVKGYGVCTTVQGEIFARKLYNFFANMQSLTLEERANVMDEISQRKGGVEEAGMLLLDLVEKSDDNLKPQLLAKLFVACAFHEITPDQFLKFSNIVNSMYIEDLKMVTKINVPKSLSEEVKSIFVANGLMKVSIARPKKFAQGYSMKELGEAIFEQGLSLSHDFTSDADLIAKVCFEMKNLSYYNSEFNLSKFT